MFALESLVLDLLKLDQLVKLPLSYATRVIGIREVLQEDRVITVNAGDPVPEPLERYDVVKVGTYENMDVYLEYRIYEGPIES